MTIILDIGIYIMYAHENDIILFLCPVRLRLSRNNSSTSKISNIILLLNIIL